MRKTIVVAVREYQAAVRTKAFIISLVLMPVLFGGSLAFQFLLKDRVDTTTRKVAVVDHTGWLFDAVAAAANERNENRIFSDPGEGGERKQTKPKFLFEKIAPADDEDRQLVDLSAAVREGKYFAFVVIPTNLSPAKDDGKSAEGAGVPAMAGARIDYHSNSPTYEDLLEWLVPVVNNAVQANRFDRLGLNPQTVAQATKPVRVDNLGLLSVNEKGEIVKAERANELANFLVPMGMMMLMLMVVMVGATPLVNSVLEEKMQRIAEVLLGSVPPFQLMLGKLIGMVGVALTISTIYLLGGFFAIRYAGYEQFFPAQQLWWFLVYQAMAVLMFGSMFAAVGAAVTDIRESQSLITPVMLVVMMPLFVWVNVVKEPTASFAVVMSLIPTATPFLMPMRQAVPPGVPIWQPLLGLVLVIMTTLLFVLAAGRIFRVGILMQGKGADVKQMLRWIVRG
ncbi:MAG: ABC transporter permease [Phycisphaerae bacterium]|nr:ABC transporter permease [Phycisphaerae bacterium]